MRSDSFRRWLVPWRKALNSLQFKASLLVILLVLVVTIVGMSLSLRLSSDALHESSMHHTRQWAGSLASGVARLVTANDTEGLVRTVNESLWTRGVAYLAIADPQRRILASGEAVQGLLAAATVDGGKVLKVASLGEPRLSHHPVSNVSYMDVTVPVFAESQIPGQQRTSRAVVGYVRLATDVSDVQAQLLRMSGRLRGISVGLLLLVALCSLVTLRKVVAPLNELSRTAQQLASGVMDARAKVALHNEIGDLAHAFNNMAERLAGAQFEMLRLNAELEERVQQRTHQLEDLAARDALTGVYNRRYFSDVIAREFAASERYDADLTCLMFDLDHFKEINDRFGHRAGDEVLTLAAQCIRQELRDADVAARFGGDEFILLLPRTSAAAAVHVADRITNRFLETARQKRPQIPATLSIGIASLRVTRARSAEALIHEADVALYKAKTAGRNRTIAAGVAC
ncbi:MAG: diguanylate cyclase [Planctomycetes bacterium]|nr:diguanylate cyclase [Planctomycetota bacterium]